MNINPNEFLWETKYRPQSVSECVLPESIKTNLDKIVKSGELSNILLCSSSPGTGKTTIARALCNDMDHESLFINASENGGIDELRTRIRQYVSSFSMTGQKKVVILDEFDQTTDQFQKAFRGFVEEFSTNARFILTANYPNKIIEPIRSRFSIYEFVWPEEEKKSIMLQMIKRCIDICKSEDIPVESNKVIAELVKRNYPDNRSMLVQLQQYSRNGQIDAGILGTLIANDDLSELIAAIKAKRFKDIRAMIPRFSSDYAGFITRLYNQCFSLVAPSSIPNMILIIGENMKYADSVVDLEIHMSALMVELMTEVEWK